jgi:hypothetical protein
MRAIAEQAMTDGPPPQDAGAIAGVDSPPPSSDGDHATGTAPPDSPGGDACTPSPATPPLASEIYCPQPGDTWDSIAAKYGLSAAVIIAANVHPPYQMDPAPAPADFKSIIIPSAAPPANVAPGDGNSNTLNLSGDGPDLLTITVADSPPSEVTDAFDEQVKTWDADPNKAKEAELGKKLQSDPWVTVATISGKASVVTSSNANYAKKSFADAIHRGLKRAYSLLNASSGDAFWPAAGVSQLAFFRATNSSHHTLGCAVDFNAGRNPWIRIGPRRKWKDTSEWCDQLFELYGRVATLTGMDDPETIMDVELDGSKGAAPQAVRFRNVHEAMKAYFALYYDLSSPMRKGASKDHLTHAIVSPASGTDYLAALPDNSTVGQCAREFPADNASIIARLRNPPGITYLVFDEATLSSTQKTLDSSNVAALKSILGITTDTDDDYLKIANRIRWDHEIFRRAIKYGGNDTRDSCNGFMAHHPAVVVGMYQKPSAKGPLVRCLGFTGISSQWGYWGDWAGDIMHFDFDAFDTSRI